MENITSENNNDKKEINAHRLRAQAKVIKKIIRIDYARKKSGNHSTEDGKTGTASQHSTPNNLNPKGESQ